MSDTARELVASSLRLIGVLASGESMGSSEATDGLAALNDLIDSWSNDNLLIPNKVSETFTLTAGTKTYTMGTGGDFDTARPQKIENAVLQIASTSPVVERPIRILNQDEYAAITQKTLESNYPAFLYSDNAYPLTSISLWPVPNEADSLVLYSSKPLANLSTLNTTLSLPPGYQRALRFNLALDLAPEYGREVSQIIAMTASESKASLKRMNHRPSYLQVDDALTGKPSIFDWRTGEPS